MTQFSRKPATPATNSDAGFGEPLSRWESSLISLLSHGQVTSPSPVYHLLRRRAARRPIYRREEYWFAALMLASCVPAALGVRVNVMRGFYAGAMFLAIPLWTCLEAYLHVRALLGSGRLEELVLTPIGPRAVIADIHLYNARRAILPTAAVIVSWIASMLLAPGGRGRWADFNYMFNMFNISWLLIGASALGIKLGLGALNQENILRSALRVAKIAVFYCLIPIGGLIAILYWQLSRNSVQGAIIAGLVWFILCMSVIIAVAVLIGARKAAAPQQYKVPKPYLSGDDVIQALENRGRGK